jgi:serine/threonine protein kinase
MDKPTTTSDFPRLPVGSGATDQEMFRSAAAGSAAAGASEPEEQHVSTQPDGAITSIHRRLKQAGGPLRLGPYDVLRRIGGGGMGEVFEATALPHGSRVALKTPLRTSGAGLWHFKNEFRCVRGLDHPNLLPVYDLGHEDGEWFFTMEYVEGLPFSDYVQRQVRGELYLGETLYAEEMPSSADGEVRPRDDPPIQDLLPPGPFHEAKLRSAIRDLAVGVAALHDAGRVHRDLNAGNVLVTREGRVVVIDFGLVTVRREPDGVHGTPGYMAPEQAEGKRPPAPANDWYAFGVMLFEALTGQLPFRGANTRVLAMKQRHEAPRPSSIVSGVPRDLEALCVDLLQRRPEDRPDGAEVLRRLGVARGRRSAAAPQPPAGHGPPPFVGREAELCSLMEALCAVAPGRSSAVIVGGPAGVGKSALLDRFAEAARSTCAVVLCGAAGERESIPRRVLDTLVDATRQHLAGPGPRGIVARFSAEDAAPFPPEAHALARLFPVLAGAPGLDDVAPPARRVDDPEEHERVAVGALAEILARLSAARPVVVLVDDAHGCDRDDAAHLAALLAPPAAGLLLVVARRTDEASPAIDDLARRLPCGARAIDLLPLAPDEALALARHVLAGHDGAAAAPDVAEAVAEAACGSPRLVRDLAAHVAGAPGGGVPIVSFEGLVAERFARLPLETQRLLEIVAAAGAPIDLDLALSAAGLGAAAERAAVQLSAARLARIGGVRGASLVRVHDDRTRAAVLTNIAPSILRDAHLCLARALAARDDAEPALVAEHFHRAGALDPASLHLERAAVRAAAAGDLDGAAEMYGRALLWGRRGRDEARALAARRAEVLANAGRASEAADVRLAYAAEAPPGEALALRARAAEDLLAAGRVDEGTSVLCAVLAAHGIGYPATPARALWKLRAGAVRLRLRGIGFSSRPVPRVEAPKLDVCWAASRVLSTVDPIRAAVFALDALLLALEAGDPARVACGLAFVGCMCAYEGSAAAEARGNELLDEAARLSWRTDDPYLLSLSWGCSGVARMCAGRFREALSRMDESLRLLDRVPEGVAWERAAYRAVSSRALLSLGALAERGRRAEAWLADARARGDRFGEAEATLALALGRIGAGDPAGARAAAREAALRVSREGFYLQHEHALRIEICSLLHEGRAQAARDACEEGFRALESSALLHIQLLRVDALLLRGLTAVAAAAAHRAGARPLLKRAEADADLLARERRPHAIAGADQVRAGVAWVRGDRDRAEAGLRAAARGYASAEMAVHAASVRRCLGAILGGDEGRRLVAAADAALAAEGVRDPARWAAMMTGIGAGGSL